MKILSLIAVLVVLVLIVVFSIRAVPPQKEAVTLDILCAGAMRPPVVDMIKQFEAKHNIKTTVSYGPAGALLQKIRISPQGDIFIPPDRYYVDTLVEENLGQDPTVFAYLLPVIMVQAGNPKDITTLQDLTKEGVRVGLVDERVGAIGRLFVKLLEKNNIKIEDLNVVYNAPIIGDLANAIKLKTIDVAIVWKPTAMLFPDDAEFFTIPEANNIVVASSACVLKSSENKAEAKMFLDYMASEEGKKILEQHNYMTSPLGVTD